MARTPCNRLQSPFDCGARWSRPRSAALLRVASAVCLTTLLLALLPAAVAPIGQGAALAAALPALTATPTTVVPGQTVSYAGSGFGNGEVVVFTWDGQLLQDQATTDSTGAFHGTVQAVPATTGTGDHQLTARGTASGRVASVSLTVPPPAVLLSGSSGAPGTTITIGGRGFGASEIVTTTLDGVQVLSSTATSTGTVPPAAYSIPRDAADGAHVVVMRGTTTGRSASEPLTVTAQVTLGVTPTGGLPGATVTVSGSGFGASEPVAVSFEGTQVVAGVTTSSGTVPGLTFAVPNPAAAGPHAIIVRGTSTGRSATGTFTVTATAALSLSKSAGPPGTTFVASGSGFGGREQVTVQFDALLLGIATTDATGTFTGITATVPAAAQGAHTLTARGQQSGLVANAPFTLTNQPVLSLSPASTTSHSVVAGSVSGFAAGELVVFSLEGTTMVTATADAEGNVVSAPLLIPSLTGGFHAITARGVTSGSTASASLAIVPSLQTETATTMPGGTLVLTGTGYASGERVDLTINGTALQTAVADASGAFVINPLTLPAGLGTGTATLSGRGESSGSATSRSLSISTPARLDLSRTPAIAGGLLTLMGRGLSANEAVSIQVDGARVRTTMTDNSGRVLTDIVLPATLGVGAHTITVVEVTTGRQVKAALTIVAPQPRVTQVFHIVGRLLTRPGAPLLDVNGILTAQVEPQTGDVTGHAQLLLSDGKTVLAPAGWIAGTAMRLRVVDAGTLLIADGSAVSGNRYVGAFTSGNGTQTRGFWAATRATTSSVVHYAFDARISSGPDAGTRYAGTLDLLGDTYGGLIGWLRLPGGVIDAVDGQQVNGNVNMLIVVRAGTPFFVVGTTRGSGFTGAVAGPLARDKGSWYANALGAALPLPAMQLTAETMMGSSASASLPLTLLSLRTMAQRSVQAGAAQTYHFAGTFLPAVGAALIQYNGVLSLQPDAATGDFSGHGSLMLSDRTVVALQGSLQGSTLRFSFSYAGKQVLGEGAAVSGNRYVGAFTSGNGTQTRGFWAATRATTSSVVHYAFDARISSGPDAGTRYAGTLDLLGDTYGGLIGWLRLPGGVIDAVDGQQVNGNVNMLIVVRAGTPFFVVGTTRGSGFAGAVAGPLAVDSGRWAATR